MWAGLISPKLCSSSRFLWTLLMSHLPFEVHATWGFPRASEQLLRYGSNLAKKITILVTWLAGERISKFHCCIVGRISVHIYQFHLAESEVTNMGQST